MLGMNARAANMSDVTAQENSVGDCINLYTATTESLKSLAKIGDGRAAMIKELRTQEELTVERLAEVTKTNVKLWEDWLRGSKISLQQPVSDESLKHEVTDTHDIKSEDQETAPLQTENKIAANNVLDWKHELTNLKNVVNELTKARLTDNLMHQNSVKAIWNEVEKNEEQMM